MNENFAKIFETETYGQILFLKDLDEECKPAIKVFFPRPGLGTYILSYSFDDTDAGFSKRDAVFERVTEDMVKSMVSIALDNLSEY